MPRERGGHGPGQQGCHGGVYHPLSPSLHLTPRLPGRMTPFPQLRRP